MSGSKRYQWLQCARGFAAFAVLLFHFLPQLQRYALEDVFRPVFQWGFWGVDIFFVLSGFVIAMSAERLQGTGDGLRFLAKRALRIYLGYWPALAIWVGFLFALSLPLPMDKWFHSLFLTSWSNTAYWLTISWTLYYELYFYLFFFVLIVLLPSERRYAAVGLAFLLITLWSGYWVVHHLDTVMAGYQPYRAVLSGYALEFFMGVFVYRVRNLFSARLDTMCALASVGIICFCLGMFSHWFDKIEIFRMASFGMAAAAVIGIALCLERFKAPTFWVRLGDASYALYLTHIFVIEVVVWAVGNFLGFETMLGRSLVYLTPALCILFALGWYRLIEAPLY
ncbi:MAG: acyltransferase, partial [Gammaproteobacteria bacterium]|nr:acyltransferase [Gammaproteobacteria bacterium]